MNEPSVGNTVGMVGTVANWITRGSNCCFLCLQLVRTYMDRLGD